MWLDVTNEIREEEGLKEQYCNNISGGNSNQITVTEVCDLKHETRHFNTDSCKNYQCFIYRHYAEFKPNKKGI